MVFLLLSQKVCARESIRSPNASRLGSFNGKKTGKGMFLFLKETKTEGYVLITLMKIARLYVNF